MGHRAVGGQGVSRNRRVYGGSHFQHFCKVTSPCNIALAADLLVTEVNKRGTLRHGAPFKGQIPRVKPLIATVECLPPSQLAHRLLN